MTATAPPQGAAPRRPRPHRLLPAILALGLVHCLCYVALVPPWQHYDEPSHLEYVLLIVRQGRLPHSGDYDLALRREIAASMVASGFYRGQPPPAIDFWSDVPPGIGVDELVHPPLYYLLAALAVWPLSHQSVEVQLYLARLCSACLTLVTLLAAYKLVAEAFPRRPRLPAAVAAFLALLPPFVDRMGSVNSDVGATAAASLMLWSAVVLARRGVTLRRIGLFALTLALCLGTKTTAAVVAVVVALALAASLVPQPHRRRLGWGAGVLLLASPIALVARRGQAAGWYAAEPGGARNRVEIETPLDNSAFLLAPRGLSGPQAIVQELSVEGGRALRRHQVTFGGWLRTEKGEADLLFTLDEGEASRAWVARATEEWQLHLFTAEVSKAARGVALRAGFPPGRGAAGRVYLDGLFLVEGALAPGDVTIHDAAAGLVRSGGELLPNLLRNGSAQRSWPSLPALLGSRSAGRSSVAEVLSSLWDIKRTAWILKQEVRVLFRSFWGTFGWNQVELPPAAFYLLLAVTLLAAAGAVLAAFRRLRAPGAPAPGSRTTWLLLLAAWATGWGITLLRIYPVFVTMRIWWPVARYADVAIVPSAVLLCAGLAALVPSRLRRAAAPVGLLGLVALAAVALGLAIVPYYYG